MVVLPAQAQPQTPLSLAQAPIPHHDQERKERMHAAWKSYRGDFQHPLKVEAGQPNDNVLANRCAPIVDKGVSFLFGQVLKLESDDQDFVDGLWGDDDDRMTCFSNMATNGGVCGQTFVKLIPAQGEMKYPRIVLLDPMLIRPVTDPEDCSLIQAYIIEYPHVANFQKRQIIARVDPNNDLSIVGNTDLADHWTITNYLRQGQMGNWTQQGASEEWLYPFPPIFSCQNLPNPNEFWGVPDLTPDLIDQNRVLNFIQSNISRIIKYHGHPIMYITGMHAENIKIGVDDVLVLPSENSKLEKLAPMDNFAGLLAFVEDIRSNMDEQSRIPSVALGRLVDLPKGNISGVALQLLFQPLIEKTVMKQRLYGNLIREVTRAALVIAGKISIEEYEDYEVALRWQNLLPIDDLAAAQTALILKQIGVSDDTIMQELGYDAESEADKSAEEDAKKLTKFPQGQGMPPTVPPNPQQQATQQAQPPVNPSASGGQNAA